MTTAGMYAMGQRNYAWGSGRKFHQDEEIEVHVFNLCCDPNDTLPCCKCGICLRGVPLLPPRASL